MVHLTNAPDTPLPSRVPPDTGIPTALPDASFPPPIAGDAVRESNTRVGVTSVMSWPVRPPGGDVCARDTWGVSATARAAAVLPAPITRLRDKGWVMVTSNLGKDRTESRRHDRVWCTTYPRWPRPNRGVRTCADGIDDFEGPDGRGAA